MRPAPTPSSGPERSLDPVTEVYKSGIDRTLLRANLALTPTERVRNLMALQQFAEEARSAGRPKDLEAIAELEALQDEQG